VKTISFSIIALIIFLFSGIEPEKLFLYQQPSENLNENLNHFDNKQDNVEYTLWRYQIRKNKSFFRQSACFASEAPTLEKKKPAVLIENNKLYQNVLAGIRIKGTTPVVIQSCDIFENGRGGMDIGKESDVRIAESRIYSNGRGGVNIEDAKSITIINTRIHNNDRGGMRIQKKKENGTLPITIENDYIYLNSDAGIRCQPDPGNNIDLIVKNNRIFENSEAGIRFDNDTHLTAVSNYIHHNATAGIIAHESTNPPVIDIYRNTISFNDGPGIHLYTSITGQIGIRNNWIYDNKRSGIICGFRDTPLSKVMDVDIINNTIVSNGSEEQGSGVRDESSGRVSVINNIIAYNYVAGIRSKSCDGFSYNLMFANGNSANCCDDPSFAPFYVEKVQYAGCPGRGKGDLITDPLFVDSDNYNFKLKQNSPAREAGKSFYHHIDTTKTYNNDIGATGGPYRDQKIENLLPGIPETLERNGPN